MPKRLYAALMLVALIVPLFAMAHGTPARAQDDLDISVFYDELAQYGDWFSHPRYGYVWSPDVDDDWRPYSRGTWIYTEDNGWYWEAEEPWGWGPFHYGRWILDDEFGWVWIPGTEWGPAWVAWRYSDDDDVVGWAPLPPEAEWYEDRGLTFSATYYDAPRFAPLWIFVEPRFLVFPSVYRHALPRTRVLVALGRTRWHSDYRFVNRRIFNAGFDVRRFERISRRPLVRIRLTNADSPRARGFRGSDRKVLHTFRPKLVAGVKPPRPPRLVDRPRREFRRQDGDRPIVRPSFTSPQDSTKGGPSRDRTLVAPSDDGGRDGDSDALRRKGLRIPDDNRRRDASRPLREEDLKQRPPTLEKHELKQPRTGARTLDGAKQEQLKQRHLRQPQAGDQPPPRRRVEGSSPAPQQFKQQGGAQPQRSGDRQQGDRRRKAKDPDRKDETNPR